MKNHSSHHLFLGTCVCRRMARCQQTKLTTEPDLVWGAPKPASLYLWCKPMLWTGFASEKWKNRRKWERLGTWNSDNVQAQLGRCRWKYAQRWPCHLGLVTSRDRLNYCSAHSRSKQSACCVKEPERGMFEGSLSAFSRRDIYEHILPCWMSIGSHSIGIGAILCLLVSFLGSFTGVWVSHRQLQCPESPPLIYCPSLT